jgi:hypothetical protein
MMAKTLSLQDPATARLDFSKLAREIGVSAEMKRVTEQEEVKRYAPPAVRGDVLREAEKPPEDQVKTFGELPTKELDEITAKAEAEIALLKKEMQAVRDLYVNHTRRIVNRITRLRAGIKVTMGYLDKLKAECAQLDIEEDEKQEQIPFQSEKD